MFARQPIRPKDGLKKNGRSRLPSGAAAGTSEERKGGSGHAARGYRVTIRNERARLRLHDPQNRLNYPSVERRFVRRDNVAQPDSVSDAVNGTHETGDAHEQDQHPRDSREDRETREGAPEVPPRGSRHGVAPPAGGLPLPFWRAWK